MKFTKVQFRRSVKLTAGLVLIGSIAVFQSCGKKSGQEVKDVELVSEVDSFSYSYGLMVSRFLKDVKHWDGINYEVFSAAMQEYLENDTSLVMDNQFAESTLNEYDKKMAVRFVANVMEENQAREGVQSLPSGLQYKVISEGEGASPVYGDSVEIHYEIGLHEGDVMFSSRQIGQPQMMLYSGEMMFPGIAEAIGKMKAGAEWELKVPPKLAFGEEGIQSIPPYSVLDVKLTLIEVYKNK